MTFPFKAHALSRAGHFIAFIYRDDPFLTKLVVFDTRRGHKEFSELALRTHGSGCPPVSIGSYLLASNGWVAEVLNGLESGMPNEASPVDELVATNDGREHYELDVGLKLSPVSLHGGTLSWTSDLGGASSVRLGPAVVPTAAQSLTACQLLGAANLTPVLGTFKASAAGGQCTYTSSSHPGMILTLTLQTGLSAAQLTGEEQAAEKNDLYTLETTPKFHISETSTLGNMNHEQLHGFVPGASLTFDMASPGSNADEQLAHLADVGLDRLCSLPVQRAQ